MLKELHIIAHAFWFYDPLDICIYSLETTDYFGQLYIFSDHYNTPTKILNTNKPKNEIGYFFANL